MSKTAFKIWRDWSLLPFIGRRSWCCGEIAPLVFPFTYRNLDLENRALDQLRATLHLFSLEKDNALKSDQVQEACKNLQTFDKKYLFKDMAVILSQYYSVSTDGVIRIPWNFSDWVKFKGLNTTATFLHKNELLKFVKNSNCQG